MAGQTLIPAGDFRTSYAADTTVFPTATSRNAMIVGIVLICFAPHILNEYSLSLLIQIGIFGIAALGLNIVVGFTGQISIGHAAFFGFGAFTSAYLSNRFGIPVFFCIPLAGVVTAAVGLIFGLPAARLKGLYLAIATLAAQYILLDFFARAEWFTGGSVPASAEPFSIFGYSLRGDRKYFYVVLVYVVVCYLLVTNLMRSRDGRALIAIRDHYLSAEIMGINLTKYRTLSFGLAAFFAGVGGALYAHYNQVVSNEGFGIDRSIIFLAMIIIGGLGSVMGTLMGTAFMVLLPESMEWLSVALRGSPIDQFLGLKNNIAFLREMAIGVIIIVFLVFEPDGLGHLADYSGATSDVGTPFGQGVADTYAWINKNGGIDGKKVNVDTVDYGYQVPRAIAQYKKWSGSDKVAAILGWGTADTEALTGFLAEDKIPDISASYAAALSDPTGAGGKAKPAPYNFFYGPSYSDAVRGMLTWAAEDWKAKGKTGKPKFVHMGANHPYPNAPKAAGEAIAAELGFELLPPIVFALTPGDYSAQCLTLKSSGANYAYLGNTAGSNISVLNACKAAGVDVQFLGNVWGMDENAAKAAGAAADGVVFPLRTAVAWGGNAPGMKTVMEISKMSDAAGTAYRPVHYIAGVCTALYMKEAVEWAAKNGGATGENVKKGFYQKADWVPAGMEGVCNASTWTDKDHRGTLKVDLYRMKVAGATDAPLNDLVKNGGIKLEKVKTIDLPRKAEWLGW